MKAVFVISNFKWGGAERQAMLLARGLKAKGIEVAVFALETNPARVDQICREEQIQYGSFPFQGRTRLVRFVASVIGIERALRRFRADVLLPYTTLPNVVCGLVWKMTGASTCIWNQRDAGVEHHRIPWRSLEGIAVRNTPHFCSNSMPGMRFLQEQLKVSPALISIIPNGVRLDPVRKSRTEWRKELGLSESTRLACMIANINRNKDHATLLRAWQVANERLATQGLATVLALAGRIGDTYPELENLCKILHLSGSVRFLGEIIDLAGLLNASDLSVFSSQREGIPNGVLEPMAAGLPVVATDLPGIRQAVGEESGNYLCPIGDADFMGQKIIELCSDEKRMKEVGARNKERVEREFTAEALTNRSLEMIQGLLERRGARK